MAGLADACAAARARVLRPERRRRAAGGLEGVLQGGDERRRRADRRATRVVETVEDGMAAIAGYPAVIKADGLAAGKGVVIAADEAEARAALEAMLVERRFGEHPVVVEEFLEGDELSVLALCDGETRAPARPGARLQAHRRRRHRARTRAAWARSRRSRRSTTRSWSGCAPRSTSRCSTSWPAAARRSTACSTRA